MTYHKIITLTFYGGRFYNNTSRKSRTIKGLFITIFTLLVVPEAFGQQHMADPVTDSLIATEKGAWEAWINNDVDFFEDYLAKEALQIHPNVRFNISQQLEDVAGLKGGTT